ncbi:SGNH/GDSL hydrolase family protein [Phytoactinopolyspora halotolerans]|uniref:SGNH/GDSL hydrolase family protein n=1 Tax=Phytoactinopolyspora halotolerans TaxID=1981512 RepID=A0A6L9SAS5_9ACTN|nr:SGNH/GDSL hydrolase family protein [Phytoactinopolyspora halotolerans]NEE02465.1 SGNH/GDSL hydrolase family protein [Phytoactinopolyspora halotolerans]
MAAGTFGRVRRQGKAVAVVGIAAATAAVSVAPAVASPAAYGNVSERPTAVVSRAVPAGVVAMGDSYSSGLGTDDYEDDCDRTQQAWAWLIFSDEVPATERTLLACSGAVIDDVYEQIDELEALQGAGGRLITLTVGGNDVGFADELVNCYVSFVSCTRREDAIRAEIDALVDPLTELYRAVQAAAPDDELIVGGYPLLVPDPEVRDNCIALTPLLSAAERQMIRRLGGALNSVIERAADEAGVRSAGTRLEETFDGHEACANGPDDWLNGLKFGRTADATAVPEPAGAQTAATPEPDDPELGPQWDIISSFVRDSFHPNASGQTGYADAFEHMWMSS